MSLQRQVLLAGRGGVLSALDRSRQRRGLSNDGMIFDRDMRAGRAKIKAVTYHAAHAAEMLLFAVDFFAAI